MMEGRVEPQERERVGGLLRTARMRAGLDIADAARYLHIRPSFLQAIEDGRFESLPAPVYAVGFVRAYAELLGLDAGGVVRRFRDEIVGLGVQAPLHFPLPVVEGSTPKGGVLLLGAIMALLAYGGWYVSSGNSPEVAELVSPVPERLIPAAGGVRPAAPPAPERAHASLEAPATTAMRGPGAVSVGETPTGAAAVSSTLPSIAGRDLPPPSPAPTAGSAATPPSQPIDPAVLSTAAPPPPASRPMPEPHPPASAAPSTALAAEPPDGGMASVADPAARIVLRAKSESWVEVREAQTNSLLAARLLKTGDVYRVPDRPGLRLVTGNAGGLVVMVDGEVAPALGREGVVKRGVPLDADVLRRGLDAAGTQ